MFTTTESEFDELPVAIQRKCFSTLERLRFAQCPSNHVGSHFPTSKTRKALCISRSSRPIQFLHRSRKKQRVLKPADVSQEDAQWYQRLPDTVRRKQFTTQEQSLLAGRCETVILDAADEALYRLGGRQANRSLPSLQSCSSSRSSLYSIDTAELARPAADMDDAMKDSFRWLDENDDLDLSLDDYHTHVVEAAMPLSKSSSRRPSFRRNLSLTNLPFGRESRLSTERAYSISGQSSRISASTTNSHRFSLAMPKQKHATTITYPVVDTPATHYQDPEARLKLRVYLASPQKFDEALEFGFPSLQGPTRLSSRRPSVSNHPPATTAVDLQTFYDDDNASLFKDHDGGDIGSPPDSSTPDTPLNTVFRSGKHMTGLKPASNDPVRPCIWHTASEPYVHAQAGDREMTLRMTLTRPDLRADESVIYRKGTQDPLALEELPPAADLADIWDKYPKEHNVVKKLWRRLSRQVG